MAIIYQGIILLLVFSLASAQTSLPNPECRGMHTAARHLQTGIKSIPFLALQGSAKAKCNPTKPCSGVICTWSSNSILEVDLHYCKDPVNYYVHFKDQGLSVDNNLTIGEKGEQVLYEKRNFVTIKIKVTKLHRIESKVTTRVVLLVCYFGRPCTSTPVLPQQTFCVRMDKCSGFNASVDHYKSCTYTSPQTTFIPSSHWSVTRTDPPYSLRSSSSDSFAQGYRREEKDKSSKDLSTGAIIGICAAGLFVILIVVGAAVYWKKYHRRTRLRAAYYNDISMHDPLCGEDFGPEVA